MVWEDEENLPMWGELGVVSSQPREPIAGEQPDPVDGVDDDSPRQWLDRVDR